PPAIFLAGTLRAIIRMRSSVRDRNALFDIAAAGPLAGLAVALPAALLGLVWSTIVPAPPGPHLVFGESVLTRALVWLRFGTLPDGMLVSTHPMADAAWFGFLVTAAIGCVDTSMPSGSVPKRSHTSARDDRHGYSRNPTPR